MKIFGGGSRHNKSTNSKPTAKKAKKVKPNQQTSDLTYVSKQVKNSAYAPSAKSANKQKKSGSIVTKILIFFALLITMVIVAGGVWLAMNVKKPDISQPTHQNDTTINDPENGDNPIINLDVGDRIDDFFTFAVCATDIDGTRTDNIMVIAFDTNKHTVNIMNIPRDTMSNVNKTGANKKINAAYSKGIEQTKKQIAQVMGFIPDKYIVVDFTGISDIVDAIGGVDYEIPFPMMYSDPTQDLEIHFPVAGVQHLDGEQVVEFLRWRKNGPGYTSLVPEEYLNGDETRIAKQQEFLIYLAKQVLTPANAFKFKDIADAVFNNVKTDITAGEMIWLAGQAFKVDTTNGINMFTLPGYSSMSTAGTNTELSFYFVNESEALSLINQYFNPYDKPIEYLDLVSGPTKSSSSSDDDEDNDDEDYDYDDEDDYTPPDDEDEYEYEDENISSSDEDDENESNIDNNSSSSNDENLSDSGEDSGNNDLDNSSDSNNGSLENSSSGDENNVSSDSESDNNPSSNGNSENNGSSGNSENSNPVDSTTFTDPEA